jgi:hypothetical protein
MAKGIGKDNSYSRVENRRLVKHKKSGMGTKRQQGYVPEGPSNRSGPGGKKATERKKVKPAPMPSHSQAPGTRKGTLKKVGPTPTATPETRNGTKLLGYTVRKSKLK